jgi:formiminotetrahydrofolate cyclodeaminase
MPQKARKETIRLPLEIAWKCLDLLKLALACVELGSYSTICDSRTASLLAEAGLRACSNNILFNLKESPEEAYNASIRESWSELNRQGDILLGKIQEQFYLRTKIT